MTPFNKRTQRQTLEQEITEIAKGFLLYRACARVAKAAQNPSTGRDRVLGIRFRGARGRAPIPSLLCGQLSALEEQHENLRKIKRFPRIAVSSSLDVINRSYLCDLCELLFKKSVFVPSCQM
jgi:hypothetical protein